MKAERFLHQKENPDEYINGYQYYKAIPQSKKMVLKAPRTRSGMFYPSFLAVIRNIVLSDSNNKKRVPKTFGTPP